MPETIAIEAALIVVTCKQTDPLVLAAGSPPLLSFQFGVPAVAASSMLSFTEKCLRKYNRPQVTLSIQRCGGAVPLEEVWTRAKIEQCIKKGSL